MKTQKTFETLKSAMFVCVCSVFVVVIVLSVYAIVLAKSSNGLVDVFGTKFLSVQTNESSHIATKGDLLIVRSQDAADIALGDAVVANTSRGYVVGTIKKQAITNASRSFVIETSADGSNTSVRVVSMQSIEGKIVANNKFFGGIIFVLQEYRYAFVLVGTLIFWWQVLDIISLVSSNQRKFLKSES